MPADPDTVDALIAWLDRLDDQGRPLLSDAVMADLVPVMLFRLGDTISVQDVPESLQVLVGRFALRAGIPEGADVAARDQAVERYLTDHPLPDGLMKELENLARSLSAGQDYAAGRPP